MYIVWEFITFSQKTHIIIGLEGIEYLILLSSFLITRRK